MAAYYNENDKFAAQWLRELIKAGLIADGEVDERDIRDVRADDVRGFTQCHFFAGIGGWSYALRLAGWPDDRPVWTGSCPCQPFSQGGRSAAAKDPRHLWPVWRPLITKCKPATIFGEQVGGKSGISWLDLVGSDMEDDGYAFASADLPGPCVDSFDLRHRLWWVASNSDAGGVRWERKQSASQSPSSQDARFRCSEFEGLVSRLRELAVPAGRFGTVSDGVSGRMGRLRGYGNAIKPPLAAGFVKAYREAIGEDLHGL